MSSSSSPGLPGARKRGRVSFCLYVAGERPNSDRARANLRTLCAELGGPSALVEIVDVVHDAERAMKDGIVATPTLVRTSPGPVLTFLGALTDLEQVRAALGIDPPGTPRAD